MDRVAKDAGAQAIDQEIKHMGSLEQTQMYTLCSMESASLCHLASGPMPCFILPPCWCIHTFSFTTISFSILKPLENSPCHPLQSAVLLLRFLPRSCQTICHSRASLVPTFSHHLLAQLSFPLGWCFYLCSWAWQEVLDCNCPAQSWERCLHDAPHERLHQGWRNASSLLDLIQDLESNQETTKKTPCKIGRRQQWNGVQQKFTLYS